LDALEPAVAPLEKVARRATGPATEAKRRTARRGRTSARESVGHDWLAEFGGCGALDLAALRPRKP
jgi:hypothetical protein